MNRLIYVSTANDSVDAEALADILETARRANSDKQITGLLLYNGLNFLQVLEGPDASVAEIYSKIVGDARHYGVVTIIQESIAERAFEDWAMEAKTVAASASELPEGIKASDNLASELPDSLPDHVRLILSNFDTLKS